MANHKSAEKRIRQNDAKKVSNKYYARTMRNALKKLRNTDTKEEAASMLPKVAGLIDRLAKMNIIHRNKAANLKSSIAKHVNSLS